MSTIFHKYLYHLQGNRMYLPRFITEFEIYNAEHEAEFRKVRHLIESGECVNMKEPHSNLSFLHMAVSDNNLKLLDYLLTREGVEVNARCSKGRTPLYLATSKGHIECVEKLIQAGSDINIPDNNNDTALHVSVPYPGICNLLLRHGARICTDDSLGTTLHAAVVNGCLEIVHMLLYYNVDANAVDRFNRTPFMVALYYGNEEAQEVLLEYVDDFNRISYGGLGPGTILSYALQTNSPFVKDIIERGADVNYGDNPRFVDEDSAFSICLRQSVDLCTFKMVWERLRYNHSKNTIDFFNFLKHGAKVPTFLQVIIESDNFWTAVKFFSKSENYFLFVFSFAEQKFDLEQLTALTCRLLEYGFRASSYVIHTIFSYYGYCELFRILLYMDNDFTPFWVPQMALSRLIFDIDYDLGSIVDKLNDIPQETVLRVLEYCICPRLVDALTLQYSEDESMSPFLSRLPRVPLLIELARNVARKQIWQSFKITNNCQFYTIINHMDIAALFKDILTFKRRLYSFK